MSHDDCHLYPDTHTEADHAMNHDEFITALIKYETEDTSPKELLELFAYLIRTGTAWGLQGHYGRNAHALMDAGYIDKDGTITPKGQEFIDRE